MARALLLEGTTLTAAARRAGAGPRAARDPRQGAAQRHQPRHRAQPLPRHLRVRRPRLRPRAARVRPARPAAPDLPGDARLRARRPVEEAGADVHELAARRPRPRRRAAPRGGRCSTSTSPPPRPTRPCGCPQDAPLERWLFVSVGAVALVAAHDARIKLGDHVAVIGLGAIGLLLVQMARLAGARARHGRRPGARRGASSRSRSAPTRRSTRATAPDGAGAAIKRSAGRGVDVAVETSGTTAGLHDAVAAPGLGGTRRHRRLLPGRRARAAPRRGVAPQPARAWSRAWAPGARRTAPTRRGTARA